MSARLEVIHVKRRQPVAVWTKAKLREVVETERERQTQLIEWLMQQPPERN